MNKCPQCGKNTYGPGPCYDQFRWIGCYDCGLGFKSNMNINIKLKMFTVNQTPKGLDQILKVNPEQIRDKHCAVINVSDSQCATFDLQPYVPSFWFPINEIGVWSHYPFYGALRVVNQYYKGDKTVMIHCHAGANRSPSVAYAILLAKGFTPEEASTALDYVNIKEVFERNVQRKHIPKNIVEFLKVCDKNPTHSIHVALKEMDSLYNEWAQKKFEEQNNYSLTADSNTNTRLVYSKEKKRFTLVNDK